MFSVSFFAFAMICHYLHCKGLMIWNVNGKSPANSYAGIRRVVKWRLVLFLSKLHHKGWKPKCTIVVSRVWSLSMLIWNLNEWRFEREGKTEANKFRSLDNMGMKKRQKQMRDRQLGPYLRYIEGVQIEGRKVFSSPIKKSEPVDRRSG